MTGRKRLFRVQKEDGSTTSNQHEILERVKEFYLSLYGDTAEQVVLDNAEKAYVFTVLQNEVKRAVQNLKNGKAPG